jgi:hypothetical protein
MSYHPMKYTKLIVMALAMTTVSVNADPAERAQLLKSALIERLVANGWQVTTETQSTVTFERRGNPFQTFLMALCFNGSGAADALIRLSFTFIPKTDHFTTFYGQGSLSQQNAFGKVQSIPLRPDKLQKEINPLMAEVATKLPKRYASTGVVSLPVK